MAETAVPQTSEKSDVRYIVRVAKTDLEGARHLELALTKIPGVGRQFSHMVCTFSGIDPTMLAGRLSESQVSKLDEVLADPKKFGAPAWMLNRRRDFETNEDTHVLLGELDFAQSSDVRSEDHTS